MDFGQQEASHRCYGAVTTWSSRSNEGNQGGWHKGSGGAVLNEWGSSAFQPHQGNRIQTQGQRRIMEHTGFHEYKEGKRFNPDCPACYVEGMMKDKKECIGCDSDFYNGNNPLGVKECWHFKDAKLVTKYAIGWWTPMDKKDNFWKTKVPNCYSRTGSVAYLNELPSHLEGKDDNP